MTLIGSISKHYLIKDLGRLFASDASRTWKVLDVGITGPEPLNFWRPLFGQRNFELDGCDVDAASIGELKKGGLPAQVKRLEACSGYDLAARFPKDAYDIVVSTQVLEHMRFPEKCFAAVQAVLKKGGVFHVTFDSAEHPRHHNEIKEAAKWLIVRLSGSERYHDQPLSLDGVAAGLERSGFSVAEKRLFSLHPLKEVLAWETPSEGQAELLGKWLDFEDYLYRTGHQARAARRYLNGYCRAIKK